MFKRFTLFQNTAGKVGDPMQHTGAIGIHPDMLQVFESFLPLLWLDTAPVRDNRTAEIECITLCRDHHFRSVGIKNILLRTKRLNQSGNIGTAVLKALLYQFQLLTRDERFISLDIHNHIECRASLPLHFHQRFPAAVCTAGMFGRGHDHPAPERKHGLFNTRIVRRHIASIEHGMRLFIHMLNHRFSHQVGQRLAGEACRRVTRRD